MNANGLLLSLSILTVPLTACTSHNGASPTPSSTSSSSKVVDASAIADGGTATAADAGDPDFPFALASGLAPTPPMGWNSWNAFSCNVSELTVETVAQSIVSSGMADAGYQYVNIDDCWSYYPSDPAEQPCSAAACRTDAGALQPNPTSFPDGIAKVASDVHALGLKLGIYGDRGTDTCAGREGSQGFESVDSQTFASWGVDYLKYDNCSSDAGVIQQQYQTMSMALQATSRPFVFSLCAWNFYEWELGTGQLWRTTSDIKATWQSVLANATSNETLAAYGGPNGWNDPDMLEVGNGMSDTEDQSHFSLWAIMAAPLIAGNDPEIMTATTQSILTNTEVIAIDQDALGLQGVPVSGDQSVWAKPLNQSGARAVVLLNTSDTGPANITFQLPEIGLAGGTAAVRDLVAHQDLGTFQDSYTVNGIASHGTATLKVLGTEPARPSGTAYLSDLQWTYASTGLANSVVQKDLNWLGQPLSMLGTQYAKGLGVYGPSLIVYRLAPGCTSFSATVGLDDTGRTGAGGSVVFQVWADDTMVYTSGGLAGPTSAVQTVQVSLNANKRLKLLVTDDNDGNALDRADWVNPQVVCSQ